MESDYVTESFFLSVLTTHNSTIMKAFVKKLATKFKKAEHTVVSNTGSAPLADCTPSAPTGSATVSAQVIQATDIIVGVQLGLSPQLYWQFLNHRC